MRYKLEIIVEPIKRNDAVKHFLAYKKLGKLTAPLMKYHKKTGQDVAVARLIDQIRTAKHRLSDALAHNGVVHSNRTGENTISSCDSEILLRRYIDDDIVGKPENLTSALNGVGGYYACIVFNDNGIVDIWRDNTATLYLATVRGLGTVIATTSEIILKTCKALKLRIESINPVLPFSHIRWEHNHAPIVFTFEKIAPVVDVKKYDSLKTFDDNSKKWWRDDNDPLNKIIALKSAPSSYDDELVERTINAVNGDAGL